MMSASTGRPLPSNPSPLSAPILSLPPSTPNAQSGTQQPQQRARQRKKRPPIEPNALYLGASTSIHPNHPSHSQGNSNHLSNSSTLFKRVFTGQNDLGPDGAEPRERKRKRANDHAAGNPHGQSASAVGSGGHGSGRSHAGGRHVSAVNIDASNSAQTADGEGGQPLVDFATLPTSALYSYISMHGLEPAIYPRPMTSDDPPPPSALLDPSKMGARVPSPSPLAFPTTNAGNRIRRARLPDNSAANRRRSMRLAEEPSGPGGAIGGIEQVPVLADVSEVHKALAVIAQRHFQEDHSVKEVETLAAFMDAVHARSNPARRFKVV